MFDWTVETKPNEAKDTVRGDFLGARMVSSDWPFVVVFTPLEHDFDLERRTLDSWSLDESTFPVSLVGLDLKEKRLKGHMS